MEPTKFDPTSHALTDDLKTHLEVLVPEAFTEDAIDFDRLKTLLGEMVEEGQERYSFTWPGKTHAIRAAQTPSIGTLAPDKEASEDWGTTQNLYLEGDNLEILKLLQKSYTGKVKMIYIDPPYNTGKDFVYPDNYSEGLKTYLEYTGQVDGEGKKITTNTETDGRYHSKWLNMMYPRLMLARNLLKNDGVIFISIDDHEQANLKKICDEIFGAENFVSNLVWKKRVSPANDSQWFSSDHEYLLVYAKKKEEWFPNRLDRTEKQNSYYSNPDNDPRGDWNSAAYTCNKNKDERPNLYYPIINPNTNEEVWPKETAVWAYSKETHLKHIEDDLLYWGNDGKSRSPRKKQFLTEAKKVVPRSVLDYSEVGSTQSATMEFLQLFEHNYFTYTKPVDLLKRIIQLSTSVDKGDIILDFFSGSATTAHAVLGVNAGDFGNRKFIMTQLQEKIDDNSEAKRAGYNNISDIGRDRIKRSIQKINEHYADKLAEREIPLDTGFRTYRLTASTFNTWDATSADDLQAKLLNATSPIKVDANTDDVLAELILKSGFSLSEAVTETEIKGARVYSVAGGELMIVLGGIISETVVRAIAEMNPKRFIAREDVFPDDSSLTNAAQVMKDKGIDFRVL